MATDDATNSGAEGWCHMARGRGCACSERRGHEIVNTRLRAAATNVATDLPMEGAVSVFFIVPHAQDVRMSRHLLRSAAPSRDPRPACRLPRRPACRLACLLVLAGAPAARGAAFVPAVGPYTCARSAPYHPRVHMWGNVGLGGGLHAALARFATWGIDMVAYGGRDMREELAALIADATEARAAAADARRRGRDECRDGADRGGAPAVLEVGCGAGTLTQEFLRMGARFGEVIAVDASPQMVAMAELTAPGATYEVGNGADVGGRAVDLVVACMVMHELPRVAHVELLEAALDATRARGGAVWIADVSPDHAPTAGFLAGEPYALDYLVEFEDTLREVAGARGARLESVDLVPGHVRVWAMTPRLRAPALAGLLLEADEGEDA